MSLKKKVIIGCSLGFALVVAIVAIVLFAPLPMPVDWDSIYDIESNVTLLAAGEKGNPSDSAVALVKKNKDGSIDTSDWKVLQFTDMHLSEQNKGEWSNERTLKEFIATIEREKPDFVALTGDIITSFRGRARAVQLCEIMEKLGVYWGYCLGNHEGDAFYKLPRKELMEIIEKYPHCLSDSTVKKTAEGEEVWGYGNFVVNLLGNGKIVQSLIFMDSGDGISKEDASRLNVRRGSYDFLKDSQKAWYAEQVNAAIAANAKSMLFIHIPLVEQRNMSYVALNNESVTAEGWTVDTPLDGWRYVEGAVAKDHDGNLVGKTAIKNGWLCANGSKNFEGVCSSDYNNGMYELMKSLRVGVNALFCGHDHVNDSVLFEAAGEGETPIYLAYGICSGYATYNLYKSNKTDDPNRLLKGYSVIKVHGDCTFDYSGVSYDCDYEVTPYVDHSVPVNPQ